MKQKDDPEGSLKDTDDWQLLGNMERAWWAFQFLESCDWSHLPEPGGFFDQSELLMTDVFTIKWREDIIAAHHKANQQQAKNDEH